MEGKKHILVVEDSPDLQALLVRLLEGEGYEMSRAYNGREALELLQSMTQLPSFILLDIMMPVMDGIEFRREQLADPRLAKVPVVVMSADADPQGKAKQLRVANVVRKPISVDQVLEIAARF